MINKLKYNFNLILYFLLFLIFFTSSFDTLLKINIFGLSLRFVMILLLLFSVVIFLYFILLNKKKFYLLPGYLYLIIWSLFIFLFSFNSILMIRGFSYVLFLFSFIVFIFLLGNYAAEQQNYQVVTRLYLFSFMLISLWGIIQFWLAFIHGVDKPFLIKQWIDVGIFHIPRINAFSYEASFFATYLIAGIPLALEFSLITKKYLYKLIFIILCVALLLSNSRMGYLAFYLYILFKIFDFYKNSVKYKIISKLSLILLIFSIISIIILPIINSIYYKFQKDTYTEPLIIEEKKKIEYKKNKAIEKPSLPVKIYHHFIFSAGGDKRDRAIRAGEVLDIFISHPWTGVSLGGIAPHIARKHNVIPQSNQDVKPFEGQNVFYEILAAGGILASVFFVLFLINIIHSSVKLIYFSGNDNLSRIVKALLAGFILQFFLLVFNQNILRVYVWVHVGVFYFSILASIRYAEKN